MPVNVKPQQVENADGALSTAGTANPSQDRAGHLAKHGWGQALKMKDLIRESGKQRAGTPVRIFPPDILQRRRNAIRRVITQRAYELFELRGREPGHEAEDWAQAESELLYPCCIDLEEFAEAIILRADLPGSFTADQLRVSIERCQVMIEGERKIDVICGHSNNTPRTHTEKRTQRVFRAYDLPAAVDARDATATLSGSRLEIWLPKAFAASEHASSTSSVGLL